CFSLATASVDGPRGRRNRDHLITATGRRSRTGRRFNGRGGGQRSSGSGRLLFLLMIFLFKFRDPLLHLLHVFLHGLDRGLKFVEFGATRGRSCFNRNEERETNNKFFSVFCNHNEKASPGFIYQNETCRDENS